MEANKTVIQTNRRPALVGARGRGLCGTAIAALLVSCAPTVLHAETSNAKLAAQTRELKAQIREMKSAISETWVRLVRLKLG